MSVRSCTSALVVALLLPTGAAASRYSAAVRGDLPAMYWRLGERDGASWALDSTGDGFRLRYGAGAAPAVEGAIHGDPDTALLVDHGTAARASFRRAPAPAVFEAWVRMSGSPDRTSVLYSFRNACGLWSIEIGHDALLHARVVRATRPPVRLVGPSTSYVTDGFWHYVVVDFARGRVSVDLARGRRFPAVWCGVFGRASVTLGGVSDVLLDEVAVYDWALPLARRRAHALLGGLGWDRAGAGGGEEG